jgi:hypothetical protein
LNPDLISEETEVEEGEGDTIKEGEGGMVDLKPEEDMREEGLILNKLEDIKIIEEEVEVIMEVIEEEEIMKVIEAEEPGVATDRVEILN